MKYGYLTSKKEGQNLMEQIRLLKKQGCEEVHCDQEDSKSRPSFKEVLSKMRMGDTLMVLTINDLAKTFSELASISAMSRIDGINIVSFEEGLDTTKSDAAGLLFERISAMPVGRPIINRFKVGRIEKDKNLEVYLNAVNLYVSGFTVNSIVKVTGISRRSFFRFMDGLSCPEKA